MISTSRRSTDLMTRLVVHVTPKAPRDEVYGWRGAELAVRVTAAPEGGKANGAVEKVIAARLGVPKSAVQVVRGHTARVKAVEIGGVDEERVREVFGEPPSALW